MKNLHTIRLSPEKQEVSQPKIQPGTTGNAHDDKYIYILTNPSGAEVYIDGMLRGTAPLVIESLTGEHTLKIRKQGYKEYSAEVELSAGKKIAIMLERE
jgi:hypothetical protein